MWWWKRARVELKSVQSSGPRRSLILISFTSFQVNNSRDKKKWTFIFWTHFLFQFFEMKQFSILLTLVLNTGLDMSPTEDTYFFFYFFNLQLTRIWKLWWIFIIRIFFWQNRIEKLRTSISEMIQKCWKRMDVCPETPVCVRDRWISLRQTIVLYPDWNIKNSPDRGAWGQENPDRAPHVGL